jgi:nicotinate-nucleotide pyrophosphorylase (carboxylating)
MTLKELVQSALREDMPNGDVTTDSLALGPRPGRARLIAKEDLVLSGIQAFELTMQTMDPQCTIKWHFSDGDRVLDRQTICSIQGDLVQVLKAERVALNFLGHLTGIASFTRKFVDQVRHSSTKILDTRKTLPVYRELEKKAVVHGGGLNHRWNLSDAILVKENHIRVAGGISKAIERIRQYSQLPVEVEASTLAEVEQAVAMKVERILLDNMSNSDIKEALRHIPQGISTEASGNMTLDRVRSVADLGVHFISVGALTHSAPCADMSLLFEWDDTFSEEHV